MVVTTGIHTARDVKINITDIDRELIEENEADEPDPINPEAEPLVSEEAGLTVDDLPRELLDGSVEQWMRKKTGNVLVKFGIKAKGGLSPAEIEKVVSILGPFGVVTSDAGPQITVRATNATTKLYKGLNFWKPAEAVPSGVAQALYTNLSTLPWQGSWSLIERDTGGTRYHGRTLNITGGRTEWATMKALVQSVSWNVADGSTVISFGPPEHLGPQDLIELQRMLRTNPVTWWSVEERTSNKYSANDHAGTRGDVVGGYNHPKNKPSTLPSAQFGRACLVPKYFIAGESGALSGAVVLNPCQMFEASYDNGGVMHPIKYGEDSLDDLPEITFASGTLWLKWETTGKGKIKDGTPEITDTEPTGTTNHRPASPDDSEQEGIYKQKIATITAGADGNPNWIPHTPGAFWSVFDREMESVGDGAGVAKKITDDKMQFRSLVGDADEVTGEEGQVELDSSIKVEEDGNEVKFSIKVMGPDMGSEGPYPGGDTGDFIFKKNLYTDVGKTISVNNGVVTDGVPGSIVFQEPLDGNDYIQVDNTSHEIKLVNANIANHKPKIVGFWEYYCPVAGEVGHTIIYGTEPTVLDTGAGDHVFTQSTDTQTSTGGTVDAS